jgi:3-dehydroquinate synthase class II
LVQVERRPLVLVKAVTPEGDTISVILQNAETVKLVCSNPPESRADVQGTSGGNLERHEIVNVGAAASRSVLVDEQEPGWCAVPVTELAPGHLVFVLLSASGRHMGMAINESLTEL